METLLQKGISPTYKTLNAYLETAIRLDNRDRILQGLRLFKKFGNKHLLLHLFNLTDNFVDKKPRNKYLSLLGRAEDIPDEIYLELREFEKQYGFVANKTRVLRRPDRHSSL